MRKKQAKLNDTVNLLIDYVNSSEIDPNVVGYALYNLEKKSFISGFDENEQPAHYSGDLENAIVFETKFDAFSICYFLEFRVISIPLLENKLFGLTPKPGSLDKITSLDEKEDNSDLILKLRRTILSN